MKGIAVAIAAGMLTAAGAAGRTGGVAHGVTHIDGDTVAAALSGRGRAAVGPLVTTKDYTVSGLRRSGPGQVEVHDRETDIFYVTDGEATFVAGGTIVGGRQTAPGQHRGTDIRGGETMTLRKGDVVTVAAGTPHWFKAVSPSISYLTVKVLK
jgi:mannose-6-phosphate isomerase-like protein (cupin superfamily)